MSVGVLVVGGGLAGCTAALAAARETSATVELVVVDDSRFDRHPGTIDVLGYTGATDGPTGEGPIERPLDALSMLPDGHPYRRLGVDRLRAALALFDDVVGYRGGEANGLVVTVAGRVRPIARYPASMAAGLASRDESMRLVGFEQAPDLDATLVAAQLDGQLPYPVTGSTVTVPGTITEYPSGPILAAALDADEAPTGEVGLPDFDGEAPPGLTGGEAGGEPVRDRLVERVLPELDTEGRVGFPAVLGETEHPAIRAEMETAFRADVFEVPVGPPSVPGRRLERHLHGALERAGVEVTRGRVTGVETADGRIERVELAEGSRAVESVVLAAGDLAGPGLVADRDGVHEPHLGCHVTAPDNRLDWTEPDPLGGHTAARFGVSVDDDLRPLDATGRPEYDNLRAAGRIVGGFDYDAEASADGVALVTGYAAGCWSE